MKQQSKQQCSSSVASVSVFVAAACACVHGTLSHQVPKHMVCRAHSELGVLSHLPAGAQPCPAEATLLGHAVCTMHEHRYCTSSRSVWRRHLHMETYAKQRASCAVHAHTRMRACCVDATAQSFCTTLCRPHRELPTHAQTNSGMLIMMRCAACACDTWLLCLMRVCIFSVSQLKKQHTHM